MSKQGKFLTPLTRYVEAKWRNSAKGQREFIDELGLPSSFGIQTLSKFINGHLANPPDDLIEALAKKYGDGVESLRQLAARDIGAEFAEDAAFDVVFGHTVWAASFVAAMLDPDQQRALRGVRFASHARFSESGEPEEPMWRETAPAKDHAPAVAGSDVAPLAAPDILHLLEDLERTANGLQLTFGLLPSELARERQRMQQCEGRYLRIATLVDTTAACCVVLPSNAEPDLVDANAVTMESLARWLAKTAKADKHFLLAEQGTIAADRAKNIKDDAIRQKQGSRILCQHLATRDLREADWRSLDEQYDKLAVVVAWDPQASWLVRNSEGAARRLTLVDSRHMTFDLCLFIPREREQQHQFAVWRQSIEKAATRLLYEVLPRIQQREHSLANLIRSPLADLERLRDYFDLKTKPADDVFLTNEDIGNVFSAIRYAASFDPEGLTTALRFNHPVRFGAVS